MGDRVEGHLAAFGRGHVAAELRHERVRGFVACR